MFTSNKSERKLSLKKKKSQHQQLSLHAVCCWAISILIKKDFGRSCGLKTTKTKIQAVTPAVLKKKRINKDRQTLLS